MAMFPERTHELVSSTDHPYVPVININMTRLLTILSIKPAPRFVLDPPLLNCNIQLVLHGS